MESIKTLADSNMEMLRQGHMTDVSFLVGTGAKQELIKAHKYMLASRSEEFFKMFDGKHQPKSNSIVVEDVNPRIFQKLLRYIYTDRIDIKNENVSSLMYAAKKFQINGLVELCGQKLSEEITVDTVSTLLEQSHKYMDTALERKCLNFIFKNARDVFKQTNFLNLCTTCLSKVIKSDELHADESSVYEAVYNWSTKACRKNKLRPTPINRLRVLGTNMHLVRFPLLDLEYFVQKVIPNGLLSKSETLQLFRHFNSRTSPAVGPFINRRRVLSRAIRFQTTSGGWNVGRYLFDSIRFQSSNGVSLDGILVYGSYIDEATYDVSVRILNEKQEVVSRKDQLLDTNTNTEYYEVYLDENVKIPSLTWFTIMLHMEGPQTKRGLLGKDMVYSEKVQFFFQDSNQQNNSTTLREGQIPGILFH